MKFANLNIKRLWHSQILLFAIIFIFSSNFLIAQSTDQEKPTPIIDNEIKGEIQPRSVGDPRLTNYYFTFNGNQGDVFVNVVTNNLDGDIDIFTIDDLEPLTKIPVFAGVQDNETGRVIYLRKPERLILRIQGRTPNDEPAKFQIKFAGSFIAIEDKGESEETELNSVKVENQGVARVNSVGTIIEVFPTPITEKNEKISENIEEKKTEQIEPPAKEIIIGRQSDESLSGSTRIEITKNPTIEDLAENPVAETSAKDEPEKSEKSDIELVFSDIFGEDVEGEKQEAVKQGEVAGKSDADRISNKKDTEINAGLENKEIISDERSKPKKSADEGTTSINPTEIQPVKPEQLSNINLVVKFKNGTKFKRSMDKVVWFNIDRGILTIITDDGNILKFSMLDVEQVNFDANL